MRTYGKKSRSIGQESSIKRSKTHHSPNVDTRNIFDTVDDINDVKHVQQTKHAKPIERSATYGGTRTYLNGLCDDFVSIAQRHREQGLSSDSESEVKNIHELTEKGNLQRFIDQIEYYLDGLRKNQKLSVVRSTAFQVAKLCDSAYIHSLKLHNYWNTLINALFEHSDFIVGFSTVYILLLDTFYSEFKTDASVYAALEDYAVNCIHVSNQTKKLSKYESTLVKEITQFISDSEFFEDFNVTLSNITCLLLYRLNSLSQFKISPTLYKHILNYCNTLEFEVHDKFLHLYLSLLERPLTESENVHALAQSGSAMRNKLTMLLSDTFEDIPEKLNIRLDILRIFVSTSCEPEDYSVFFGNIESVLVVVRCCFEVLVSRKDAYKFVSISVNAPQHDSSERLEMICARNADLLDMRLLAVGFILNVLELDSRPAMLEWFVIGMQL
jgi:hypothetical protein